MTHFVGILVRVRDLLWLSSNSTLSRPYKRLANVWLDLLFQISSIVKMSKHQPQFFPIMNAIYIEYGYFITFDYLSYVEEFRLLMYFFIFEIVYT